MTSKSLLVAKVMKKPRLLRLFYARNLYVPTQCFCHATAVGDIANPQPTFRPVARLRLFPKTISGRSALSRFTQRVSQTSQSDGRCPQ